MNTLLLEPGDLLQIKSTDLPPGQFVKLQPQSPAFLDISDPRAVLENAFRNFACLTKGDIFTFSYNDQTFDMAVLDIKPDRADHHAIVTMETDLEVDFATPVGYEPPQHQRTSGTSTPGSSAAGVTGQHMPGGGPVHYQGSMAQSINYAAIAPNSQTAAQGAQAASSNFLSAGHKLKASSKTKSSTSKPSTSVAGASSSLAPTPSNNTNSSTNTASRGIPRTRRLNGPQPLRLPPGKLFFGYEIKPVRKKDGTASDANSGSKATAATYFQGVGQKVRSSTKRDDSIARSALGSGAGSSRSSSNVGRAGEGSQPVGKGSGGDGGSRFVAAGSSNRDGRRDEGGGRRGGAGRPGGRSHPIVLDDDDDDDDE